MRIGFSLGSILSIDQIIECSKILSHHNADSLWIPETWGMDSGSMIATVLQLVKTPKLGTSIINIYSRSPSLIAMTAATLDTLSGGRLILGLGTSSQTIVEDWHGVAFEHPLDRMREYVEIIRLILSGQKANYQGNELSLKNFDLLIKPPRKKIPIYLAAINQRMVDLTWDIADGVIFYLRPLTELKETVQRMQNKKRIDTTCQIITSISEDSDKAISRAKKTIAFYVSVGKIYREFLATHGFEKETKAIFTEYKKSGLKDNHQQVSDRMVNELSICGTPETVQKKITQFVKAGIDLPILQFNPVDDNVKESFNLLVSTLASDMN